MLGNTTNQSSKFRAKTWVEVNDDSQFKATMLMSILCDCSDIYILVKETIIMEQVKESNKYHSKIAHYSLTV